MKKKKAWTFYLTLSGRCYVVRDGRNVYFYDRNQLKWVPVPTTVQELEQEPRCNEVEDEDAFGVPARRSFREQFEYDSRKKR